MKWAYHKYAIFMFYQKNCGIAFWTIFYYFKKSSKQPQDRLGETFADFITTTVLTDRKGWKAHF